MSRNRSFKHELVFSDHARLDGYGAVCDRTLVLQVRTTVRCDESKCILFYDGVLVAPSANEVNVHRQIACSSFLGSEEPYEEYHFCSLYSQSLTEQQAPAVHQVFLAVSCSAQPKHTNREGTVQLIGQETVSPQSQDMRARATIWPAEMNMCDSKIAKLCINGKGGNASACPL